MKRWSRCALGLVALAGCTTPAAAPDEPSQQPEPTSPTTVEPAPAAKPTFEVTVFNLSGVECQYALHDGDGWPPPEAPTTALLQRASTLTLAKDRQMCVKNPKGEYGTGVSVDGPSSQIIVYKRCSAVAASKDGFTPKQRAMAAPHTMSTCCRACEAGECTGCTEPKPSKPCRAKVEIEGRCSLVDDVLDCVPASDVEADGSVRGFGPFRDRTAEPKPEVSPPPG